jgi:hypothetical protein
VVESVRRALTSVRARLLLLVGLAVLPALLLTLYTAQDELTRARQDAENASIWFAEAEADTFGKLLESTQRHLITLAETGPVRGLDPAGCSSLLQSQLAATPSYANLGAVLPSGDRFCSGQPGAGPANLNDREYIRRAIQTRRLSVGAFGIDRAANRRFIGIAQPAVDGSGNLRSVIYAALDLAPLDQLAGRASLILPPRSTITLLDRGGIILVRYPDSDEWVGQAASQTGLMPLASELLTRLDAYGAPAAPIEGAPGTDLDRVARSFAVRPLAGTADPGDDMVVLVGIDSDAVLTTYRRNLIAVGAVALLIVVAAWVGGNVFLLRRLSRLTHAARAMEHGQLSSAEAGQLAATTGADELAQLSQRFGQMAREVLAREESLRRQVEELRVEIDAAKRSREVSEITQSDYFQNLRSRASELRRTHGRPAPAEDPPAAPA